MLNTLDLKPKKKWSTPLLKNADQGKSFPSWIALVGLNILK